MVWLGGHAPYWPHTNEFNLKQDVHAARVLLDAKIPLVLLPCYPVSTSHLIVTVAELEEQLAPHSKLGSYLTAIVGKYAGNPAPMGWSKVIWDIAASAWAVNRTWVTTDQAPSPILKDDLTWEHSPDRRVIEIAREVDRNAIFADFFTKARENGAD